MFQLVIKPYHYAVFSVNLVAPNYEGAFAAEIHMTTQFEVRIPFFSYCVFADLAQIDQF